MQAQAEGRTAIDIIEPFLATAPVDLDGMARALGVAVDHDAFLAPDVAGRIEQDGAGYRVTINARDNARRQRFTLAHELAHFILHRDLIGDGITDSPMYRSRMSSEIESQANRFAATLLMPAALMRATYRSGNRSIAGLAQHFDVSPEAAMIRMRDLGFGP